MFKVVFSWPIMLGDEPFVRYATDPADLRVLLEDLKDGGATIESIDDYVVNS